MEEDILNGNNGIFFDAPKEQASYIKVIGVGGGGSNAVNYMYRQGIKGVDFIVCNTDNKSLMQSPVPTKIQLGNGLGAGNNPKVAEAAAREKAEHIKEIISDNTKMLFITAGMGGGTGTGAAPVIAEIAKEITLNDDVEKILTVAIVTFPLSFEGPRRKKQAEEGIAELRKYVDSIIIINNDKLRDLGNMVITKAFAEADKVLLTAAKGIAEIITVEGYVAVDFRDVNTVMANSGTALMGAGIAAGENRALEAIELASTSVLLNDNDIAGAKNILLYFSFGNDHEITMDEMEVITNYINNLTGGETDIIWGMGLDENMGENLSITLVATGFEAKKIARPSGSKIELVEDKTTDVKTPVVKDNDEIILKKNTETTVDNIVLGDMPNFNPAGFGFGDSTPTSSTSTTQQPTDSNKRVWKLDEDNNTTTATMPKVTEHNDDDDFGIILKHQPTIEEERDLPQKHEISHSASISEQGNINGMDNVGKIEDATALSRAQRIARMHSMLGSDAGLEKLRSTPAYLLRGEEIYQTMPSSVNESAGSIGTCGISMENSFLHSNPD